MISDPKALSDLEFLLSDPLSDRCPVERWQALSGAAADPNPFFGPAFLKPYLQHMAPQGIRLAVVRNRASGDWLLAAPVGMRRFGLVLPVKTVWATHYAPLGTPLVHPVAGPAEITCFVEGGGRSGGLLAIPYLPSGSRAARLLAEALPEQIHLVSRARRAAHDGGAAGKAQLEAACSGKRGKEWRRLFRRLGDHGPVRFESLSGADAVAAFEEFLAVEASGWKGRAGTALASRPDTVAFARAAVANLAGEREIRIDLLRAGEKLVAALVSFVEGGWSYSWKIAYDEDFARYSPGVQIALQAFRENLALTGFKGADSLAVPGHSMIEPLWPGRLETATMLIASGAVGDAKRRLAMVDLAAEQTLRQMARSVKRKLRK
ncbi:GNAT family N-acetyltransferase [Roseibium sp.]|uniref:GNAT family N-acetyltransferase n=1 Tax=Roseibium sp. TaxID=1936156 RepID=UPI003D0DD79A